MLPLVLLLLGGLCVAPSTKAAQGGELKVPAEVAPFVEIGTKAVALEAADLNGDGTPDVILVLESLKSESEEEEGSRSLLILKRSADNKLSLAKRNDMGVVYCRTCGGAFGDPLDGIEVGTKTFTVNHMGGSAWRWTARYKFNYSRIHDTWQLVRVTESSFHTSDPNKFKERVYTPPRDFGKIDIADFDPEHFLKKAARPAQKK